MSRQPTEFTQSIRQLLDDSEGSLTYGQIRPLLEDLGYEIAQRPSPASEDWDLVMEYEIAGKFPTDEEFEGICDELNFKGTRRKNVLNEFTTRKEFIAERNHFDVTKYNWNNDLEKSQKRLEQAQSMVETLGGTTKVKKKIAANNRGLKRLRSQLAKLESEIDQVESDNDNLQSALNQLKEVKAA